jgi:hypothetical protein
MRAPWAAFGSPGSRTGARSSRPGRPITSTHDLTGEGAKAPTKLPPDCDTPPLRHQAPILPAGNEHRSKCLVNVHPESALDASPQVNRSAAVSPIGKRGGAPRPRPGGTWPAHYGRVPEMPPNRRQQPATAACGQQPVDVKLARAWNSASTARDTLVMRRSLGDDEDQGAEVPRRIVRTTACRWM